MRICIDVDVEKDIGFMDGRMNKAKKWSQSVSSIDSMIRSTLDFGGPEKTFFS